VVVHVSDMIIYWKPGQRTRYSDWLRVEQPKSWSSSPGRVKNFLFSTSSRPAVGSTQLPIQWVQRALPSGVMRAGRETNHSPPASTEVKKMWMYTSTSPYVKSALVFRIMWLGVYLLEVLGDSSYLSCAAVNVSQVCI
jgi:hypothetical protein